MVGWLELQLDDAPVVVLAGVNDPFLPEAVTAHPHLPNALRSRLGLEDNQARYARDAYRLTALLHSTRTRLLLAGLRTAQGDPLRPSRILLTDSGSALARRVLRLTGQDPGGEAAAREERSGREDPGEGGSRAIAAPEPGTVPGHGSGGFSLPPLRFVPIPALPRPLPVTAFRALLDDPFLWALRALLGLQIGRAHV